MHSKIAFFNNWPNRSFRMFASEHSITDAQIMQILEGDGIDPMVDNIQIQDTPEPENLDIPTEGVEIVHRYTGCVIVRAPSIREGVEIAIREGISLAGAKLAGADLSELNLRGADFHGANLRGADFSCADITDVNFQNVDLAGANFDRAIGFVVPIAGV